MEILVILALFFAPIFTVIYIIKNTSKQQTQPQIQTPQQQTTQAAPPIKQKYIYKYTKRRQAMTTTEIDFYNRLCTIVDTRYTIIPQAHLTMIFDQTQYRQNWHKAFFAINGKSVDFLIVNHYNFAPILAIEIDDKSHSQPERIERDLIVEEIFREANMPLLRFSYGKLSNNSLITQKVLQLLELHT